ncbi:MAG: GtrA family protein [Clostridiales bacterium]|nr:GtrA family protein [Clostridiales bacterium]
MWKTISRLFTREGIIEFFHSELFRYGIGGGSVTVINFVLYTLLVTLDVKYTVANVIALVVSKTWGYFINKFYIFRSHTHGFRETLAELIRFVAARGFTGLVDYFGVVFLVEIMQANELFSKYFIMVLIIVLNYVLGKKAVFVKKES